MKIQERKRAEELRKQGWSYNQIAKELLVSKGTLTIWLADVPLTDLQRKALEANCRIASIEAGRKTRDRWIRLKRNVWDSYDPPLFDQDFTFGLGLYWGEGNKTGVPGLANSDAALQRRFISWAKRYFDANSFAVKVQHYQPEQDDMVKAWWSRELSVPLECFTKSFFKPSSLSKRKRNTLEHGTATVTIKNREAWKIRLRIDKALNSVRY